MADNYDLKIRVSAQLDNIKQELATLRSQLNQVGDTAKKTGSSSAFGGLESSVSSVRLGLSSVVGMLSSLAAAAGFGALIQQGTQFNAQLEDARTGIASIIASQAELKNATGQVVKGQEAFKVALALSEDQMRKLRIAGLETAATTTELVDAYQSAIGPGLAAGLNLDQVRSVTIQLTQAAGALGVPYNQLSQEIRSILAGEIDINSRVASTLGITNDQVRNWKAQNTLASELSKRLESFSIASKEAANNFSVIKSNAKEAVDTLAGTVAEDFTNQLKGGLKAFTEGIFDTKNLSIKGDLAEAVGFARELAGYLGESLASAITGSLDLVRQFSSWLKDNRSQVDEIMLSFKLVGTAVGQVVKLVASIVGGVADAGVKTSAFATIIQTVALLIAGLADGVRVIGAAVVGVGAVIVKSMLTPLEQFLSVLGKAVGLIDQDAAKAIDTLNAKVKGLSQGGFDLAGDILAPIANGEGAVAKVSADIDKLNAEEKKLADDRKKRAEEEKQRQEELSKNPAGSAGARPKPGPQADATKLAIEDTKNALSALDKLYQEGNTRLEDYYARKRELVTQLGQLEVQEAAKALKDATDDKARNEAATKLEIARRQAAAARATLDADERIARQKRDEDVRQETEKLQASLATIEGRKVEARTIEIEAKYRKMLGRMRRDGDTKGAELVDKLINAEKAQAKFDDIEARFKRTLENLRNLEESLSNQVRVGSMSPAEARARLEEERAKARDQMSGQIGEAQTVADANPKNADIQQGLEGLKGQYDQTAESAKGLKAAQIELEQQLISMKDNVVGNVATALRDSLTNFFVSLTDRSKTAKEKVADFARGFLASMAQIAAQALATYAVLLLLNSIPGGSAVAASMNVSAGIRHTGGMAGNGGTRRQVNPALFAAAPRYHVGGVAGLKPGEFPAILQQGETIRTQRQEADVQRQINGGKGTRIINVVDPSLVHDYMSSASGEEVILNTLQRNSGMIKQVLA